jgi:hypothetical protein
MGRAIGRYLFMKGSAKSLIVPSIIFSLVSVPALHRWNAEDVLKILNVEYE